MGTHGPPFNQFLAYGIVMQVVNVHEELCYRTVFSQKENGVFVFSL